MRQDTFSYRADIDGWRAIAVVAVIAHHFDKTWLPGGYLGVDVFFVISGFVITLSLLDRKAESFLGFLADFYARRIRRLMPALIFCVALTSIGIWFVDPASRQSLSTGLAALFGAANIQLASQDVDYFSPSTELNAFTHTWSLGVEEQFYLIFPLLLWFLAGSGQTRTALGMRRFVIVLSAAMVASFAVFLATAQTHPVFNYYQLPARFWELAAGALTFIVSRRRDFASYKFTPLAAAAVLAVTFVLPVEQRVPATTAAVLATMALLVTTPSSKMLRPAMTQPVMRFIGRISYPLYLWHWSVLALSRFTIGVSVATLPFQLALMLALSWATYRFIETPVRGGAVFPTNRRILAAGLCLAAVVAAIPITLRLRQDIGPFKSAAYEVVPSGFLPLIGSGGDFLRVCVLDGGKRQRKDDTIDQCTVPPVRANGPTIWVFGDSHAGQLQAMLYAVRDETGAGLHLIETPNTPFPSLRDTPAAAEGRKTFDAVSPRFRAGDIVVLGRLFLARDGAQRALPDVAEWSAKVAEMADQLETRGVRLVVIGPLPMFRFASVLSCARSSIAAECVLSRETLVAPVADAMRQVEAAGQGHANLAVFHPFNVLCPPAQAYCTPFLGDGLAFRDKDHLNVLGSAALAKPFLEMLGLPRSGAAQATLD